MNEQAEAVSQEMWEHFPSHLEFSFILAARCEQSLLFQGHHIVQLLLCQKDKTPKLPVLAYGYCHEITATMKQPDKSSGSQAPVFEP